jgi:hypothetical protein
MTIEKYPAESTIFDFDCSEILAASETITGTPALAFLPALTGGDGLSFGAPVVNPAPVTYSDGRVVAIGKVIQVRISAGTATSTKDRRSYAVRATFATSAGNTLVAKALLYVLPEGV